MNGVIAMMMWNGRIAMTGRVSQPSNLGKWEIGMEPGTSVGYDRVYWAAILTVPYGRALKSIE